MPSSKLRVKKSSWGKHWPPGLRLHLQSQCVYHTVGLMNPMDWATQRSELNERYPKPGSELDFKGLWVAHPTLSTSVTSSFLPHVLHETGSKDAETWHPHQMIPNTWTLNFHLKHKYVSFHACRTYFAFKSASMEKLIQSWTERKVRNKLFQSDTGDTFYSLIQLVSTLISMQAL